MKPFALARVLALAEQRAEALSRAVKHSHGIWLRARARLVQLNGLRDAHIAQLGERLRGGVTAAQLLAAQRLQQTQAADRAAAQAAIDAAWQTWQARLAEWMQAAQRVEALQRLEARHRAQLAMEARRNEQRQHDELAELRHRRESGRRRP